MDTLKIFKALANESRQQILHWLKDPNKHFTLMESEKPTVSLDETGVYVGLIQQKSGLSQSTVSHYLAVLQEAGLLKANRVGQWTYYKRDEHAIAHFLEYLEHHL